MHGEEVSDFMGNTAWIMRNIEISCTFDSHLNV